MEWVTIIGQILGAIGPWIAKAIEKAIETGDPAHLLDIDLRDILPHELKSVIAKKVADEAALRKFGGT